MSKPQLPELCLVDEIVPGGDILQEHEVVDVLDRILGRADSKLSVDGCAAQKIAHGICPDYVAFVISKEAAEVTGL